MAELEQTNEELSRAVAVAMGAPEDMFTEDGLLYFIDGSGLINVPQFAESMDACLAPGGPVEYLRGKPPKVLSLFHEYLRMEVGKRMNILPVWWYLFITPEDFCLAFLAATEGER